MNQFVHLSKRCASADISQMGAKTWHTSGPYASRVEEEIFADDEHNKESEKVKMSC